MANPLLQNAFSNATAPLQATVESVEKSATSLSPPAEPLFGAANATARSLGQTANSMADAANSSLPPSADMWGGYFQALGAVFLLLAVLALAFYLLKRYGPKAGLRSLDRGSLKMESQLPLGPKKSVTVVRFLNKRLVLGVTETQINLLTTVEVDHDREKTEFSESLAKAQKNDSPT